MVRYQRSLNGAEWFRALRANKEDYISLLVSVKASDRDLLWSVIKEVWMLRNDFMRCVQLKRSSSLFFSIIWSRSSWYLFWTCDPRRLNIAEWFHIKRNLSLFFSITCSSSSWILVLDGLSKKFECAEWFNVLRAIKEELLSFLQYHLKQ
jgi:hypothetical protein